MLGNIDTKNKLAGIKNNDKNITRIRNKNLETLATVHTHTHDVLSFRK